MHQQEDVLNMIWEVDDDLNGYVNWEEFLTMYKRAVFNSSGWLLVAYIMCAYSMAGNLPNALATYLR